MKHGRGKFSYYQQGECYDGEWQHGERHGRGTYHYSLGTKYEGYWERGLKWGRGTVEFSSGTRYDGMFASDKATG